MLNSNWNRFQRCEENTTKAGSRLESDDSSDFPSKGVLEVIELELHSLRAIERGHKNDSVTFHIAAREKIQSLFLNMSSLLPKSQCKEDASRRELPGASFGGSTKDRIHSSVIEQCLSDLLVPFNESFCTASASATVDGLLSIRLFVTVVHSLSQLFSQPLPAEQSLSVVERIESNAMSALRLAQHPSVLTMPLFICLSFAEREQGRRTSACLCLLKCAEFLEHAVNGKEGGARGRGRDEAVGKTGKRSGALRKGDICIPETEEAEKEEEEGEEKEKEEDDEDDDNRCLCFASWTNNLFPPSVPSEQPENPLNTQTNPKKWECGRGDSNRGGAVFGAVCWAEVLLHNVSVLFVEEGEVGLACEAAGKAVSAIQRHIGCTATRDKKLSHSYFYALAV
ncbi:uncharacterized protein MONOS_17742 [Monocercomonoides exilis]|uniref:uncharacterized protein n=1 Tax=Monocercomonoides exilis TaxID=2049356 RepID=UPI0035599329|nr:hypothetical protein MONOS_17742 [Monocercomonoides exilis]